MIKIHSHVRSTGRRTQSGLSILEVLIALAVLSIGLAGLALMHMNALQYVHSAYYRSLASAIALDFEERLWLQLADDTVTDCPDPTATGDAYTELLADWKTRTAFGDSGWPGFGPSRLASIRNLTITPGSLTGTTFAEVPVTITWTDARFDDDNSITDESATESYVYNVRLLCKVSAIGTVPTP
jgi:type IV pilus assembly protein PilV